MFKKYFITIFIVSLIGGCSSDSIGEGNGNSDSFNREALLTNTADNIIIPAFKDFESKLEALKSKFDAFTNTPNTLTFAEVKVSWYEAYKVWQYVAVFDIGKAEEIQFVNHFNIYPLNVTDLERNITTGTYDLSISNNHDAQGFPALDYLFNGLAATEADIVAKFVTDAKADAYKKYVLDVISKMTTVTSEILNDWNTGFRDSFVKSTENTATSFFNKMVNDYIFHYEKRLRTNKIGIPAGAFSNSPLSDRVEAFYSKSYSRDLALEALQAVNGVFSGTAYGKVTSGESFQTYLNFLNRADLTTSINNQLEKARVQLASLNTDLSKQVIDDNSQMTMAFDELNKVVVLLKVDMLQAFNVSVDYVDADGD